MSQYINIKDIICDNAETNKQKLFQVQPHNNGAFIMHIGYSNCISDIVLFDKIIDNYDYRIISCLLDNISNDYLPIVCLLVYKKEKLIHQIQYNFVPKNQKSESSVNKKILIDGSFTITFHKNNKYGILKTYDVSLDIESIISEMLILSLDITDE